MRKMALLTLLLAVALISLSAACGGGEEDVKRLPIRHLDFTGVEISFADYFNPPFADAYPEVVAEVSGEPITGEALAARQVMLELNRRDLVAHPIPGELGEQQLSNITSLDPLEALIDEELQRQAVERMDLLPSYEEAVEYTREIEESFKEAGEQGTPEERQQMLEFLRRQGWPTEDWASSEEVVEGYRQQMGIGRLKNEVCKREATVENYLNLSVRYDCDDLLREERSRADIDYFVEWVD